MEKDQMGQEGAGSFTSTLKWDTEHAGCDKGQLPIDLGQTYTCRHA